MIAIAERANGRWRDILSTLGVPPKCLVNRHGPCPICGGKDRFRWDNKQGKGTFFCSNCGAGSGAKLLMLAKGWDYKRCAEEIEKVIGSAKVEASREVMSDAKLREAMQSRWKRAERVLPGSPVDLYLQKRLGRQIEVPSTLRSDAGRPAMVAIVQAPDDVAATAHITLLTEDGEKAPTDKVRLFMPGSIAMGSAVRLGPAGEQLGIAEGIETALAASILHKVPVWAALNERLLQQFEPPPGVKRLLIFGDNDRNCVGQCAAYTLGKRLMLRRKDAIPCEVLIPEVRGDDWNDVLKKYVN